MVMVKTTSRSIPIQDLRLAFGHRLQENVTLAHYTTARVGGPCDALLPVNSAGELADAAVRLWDLEVPFFILGGGSNILVSDRGYRGVVVLNRARNVRIDARGEPPAVWAESGANLGAIGRQAAVRGLSGLEWAAAIPGTVGGAVYGNAGAHGGDVASSLIVAEILHRISGKEAWTCKRMAYQYRSSILKREAAQAVILSATLQLSRSTPEAVKARLEEISSHRRSTQPPGASMGSMFKNPAGDFAGRLIDQAGLKGTRIGGAEISTLHGNFFVNRGGASAADVLALIRLAQRTVADKFGISLELEIELVGDWEETETNLAG
jgi:UDP-N-acetylmuramate dehydrogenase